MAVLNCSISDWSLKKEWKHFHTFTVMTMTRWHWSSHAGSAKTSDGVTLHVLTQVKKVDLSHRPHVALPPSSRDAVSFFSNVGKSWAQRKTEMRFFPVSSRIRCIADGIVNSLLWWFWKKEKSFHFFGGGDRKEEGWSNPRRGNPPRKNKRSRTKQTSEEIRFNLKQM